MFVSFYCVSDAVLYFLDFPWALAGPAVILGNVQEFHPLKGEG